MLLIQILLILRLYLVLIYVLIADYNNDFYFIDIALRKNKGYSVTHFYNLEVR